MLPARCHRRSRLRAGGKAAVCLLLLLACFGMTPAARASDAAYLFTGANVTNEANLILGFVFTVNQNITVDALGYYDHDQDGFLGEHQVGIWNSSGTLLASTTLAAGTGETLDGKFRYKSITGLSLTAGQTYTIGGKVSSDKWAYGVDGTTLTGLSVHPAISGISSRYGSDSSFNRPEFAGAYTLYAGPNFKIAGSEVVPEPAFYQMSALLALGGWGMLRMRRRKV